jgi:threonine/homoserine/homoserine lactone efflux protein
VQEAAARGFGAGLRVIVGSATADLLLIGPALGAAWLLAQVDALAGYVALFGAAYFVYLSVGAVRDGRRLWLGRAAPAPAVGWAFGKGVLGNLLNPLTWSFWLATGTPTMLRAHEAAGWPGLVMFTAVWFGAAMLVEAAVALAVVRSGRALGRRALGGVSLLSAGLFLLLAAALLR